MPEPEARTVPSIDAEGGVCSANVVDAMSISPTKEQTRSMRFIVPKK
jgi:hypothetical protein